MRRDDSVIIYTGRGASRTLKRGVENCERGKKRVEYIHTHTHICTNAQGGIEKGEMEEEREKEEWMIGLFCAKIGVCWRK